MLQPDTHPLRYCLLTRVAVSSKESIRDISGWRTKETEPIMISELIYTHKNLTVYCVGSVEINIEI